MKIEDRGETLKPTLKNGETRQFPLKEIPVEEFKMEGDLPETIEITAHWTILEESRGPLKK